LIHLHRLRQTSSHSATAETEFTGASALATAVWHFETRAKTLDTTVAAVTSLSKLEQAELRPLNDAIQNVERSFLIEAGLPDRPWFKHAVYAPGTTTGYAAWPLPAVRGALEDKSAPKLASAISETVKRIEHAASALSSAQKSAQDILNNHKAN
jgi:N-acetylated-alpha-linked acidic dipeptidase